MKRLLDPSLEEKLLGKDVWFLVGFGRWGMVWCRVYGIHGIILQAV